MGSRPKPEPQEIPDDAELTQWGEWTPEGAFSNMLRPEIGETDKSLVWGRHDPRVASLLINKLYQPLTVVRYTTAELLRSQNFEVIHTPRTMHKLHVSVYPPMEGPARAAWDEDMAKRFDACFTDTRR